MNRHFESNLDTINHLVNGEIEKCFEAILDYFVFIYYKL